MADEPLFPTTEDVPTADEPAVEPQDDPLADESGANEEVIEAAPDVPVTVAENADSPQFITVEGLYDADGEAVVPLDEYGRLEVSTGSVDVPAKVAENLEAVPSLQVGEQE